MWLRHTVTKIGVFAALAALTASLAGCGPLLLAVGAGSAAAFTSKGTSEKGLKGSISDLQIRTDINHRLFTHNVELFRKTGVTVEKARVFLTGSVENPEGRLAATRLAWQARGVREVVNELQINDTSSLVDKARDAIISTELSGLLLLDREIRSINFSLETINGVVYLFGIARTEQERDRVSNHARNIEYVKNVVNHVTLTDEE